MLDFENRGMNWDFTGEVKVIKTGQIITVTYKGDGKFRELYLPEGRKRARIFYRDQLDFV